MAAGNQVFHVVVDTDDIATHISGLLCREKVLAWFSPSPSLCLLKSNDAASAALVWLYSDLESFFSGAALGLLLMERPVSVQSQSGMVIGE